MTIDTTNMRSHLQRKLYEGEYRAIREQIESDPTLTAGYLDLTTEDIKEILKESL